ncbi:hypothetical protein C8Q73DRAFT_667917 [Cubamyces lactineus]|nr:hypothetical protein C8Q73DRAFT_667917 [Cubamyces lactineus]
MANTSGLPTGPPAPTQEPAPVPHIPPPRTPSPHGPAPRTPSPNGSRELRVDPPAPSDQQSESDAAPATNTSQGALPVPKHPFSLNDASPAGKKTYFQSGKFSSVQNPLVEERRQNVRNSMSSKSIIVEYNEFMEWFVPAPHGVEEPTTQLKALDFKKVATKPELNMYQPLVDALNPDWLLPGDEAISNAYTPDPNEKSKLAADAGIYRRDDAARVGKHTKWAYMELSIECKTEDVQHDPFEDSGSWDDNEPDSDRRKDVLGQIMCYSVLIFDNQRRTHHFMLMILGKMARIIRWDRSGLVATKKFNYVSQPELMGRFIWRFARMSAAQRGHDTTATRISPDSAEYRLMKMRAKAPKVATQAGEGRDEQANTTAIPGGVVGGTEATGGGTGEAIVIEKEDEEAVPGVIGDHARAAFAKSLRADPICWRLRVDDAQKGARYFLVGRPHFIAFGLAGRGTQTFIAVDEADPQGPLVYLKDAWRVAHTGIKQEGEILEKLNSKDDGGPVPFIPTVRYHGDVGEQVTRSQEIWDKKNGGRSDKKCPLKTHRHYRLVVNEVGLPLDTFLNASELVGIIIDCIQAHNHAYNRKRLIHRDISAGNVLIYPKLVTDKNGSVREARVGLLADWELAKCIDDDDDGPRQPDRTGTWQFLSANALSHPSKRIMIQDDMESLFHLLLYQAIRYLPHNCYNVGMFIDSYFDGYLEERGVYLGGEKKMATVKHGTLTTGNNDLKFYLSESAPTPTVALLHSSSSTSDPGLSELRTEPDIALARTPETDSTSGTSSAQTSLILHPINSLFADLLELFKAHYALNTPTEETPARDSTAEATREPEVDLMIATRLSMLQETGFEYDWSLSAAPAPDRPPAISPEAQANMEASAAKLASHKALIKVIVERYAREKWPKEDRVPDKLPENYRRTNGKKRAADSTWQTSRSQLKRSRASGKPPV